MASWREILRLGSEYLSGKGVPDAEVAAELLAARLLKCGRGFLAMRLDGEVPERMLEAMRRGIRRLASGEPVQYVLGEWDFRSLTLGCDRRALIPRPETEKLAGMVIDHLNSESARRREKGENWRPTVVDVGTGTGCIILSIASEYAGDALLAGLDISQGAVELARENAKRCGLEDRVKFAVADGLDDFDEPQTIDVIVSNPPYVTTAECATLDARVREWEPREALDGGREGMDFIERYTADALNLLKPGGKVFFEIGGTQGAAVGKLLFDAGFEEVKVEKDYEGHDRYVSATLP